MGFPALVILSFALAMDAMAVTLSNALCIPAMGKPKKVAMVVAFGLFQGLMPVIGYVLGDIASVFLERFGGWVTLVVLGFIGIQMAIDGIKEIRDPGLCDLENDTLTYRSILIQAVATSIDALLVGVSFAVAGVSLWIAAPLIAVITAICCFAALLLGAKLGLRFGSMAKVAGGLFLIGIGVRSLF